MSITFVWSLQVYFFHSFWRRYGMKLYASHMSTPEKIPPKFSLIYVYYYRFVKNLLIHLCVEQTLYLIQ
jgi:hypothetical protein